MSDSNEEPYSTIFTSLKHPIRRRILRMLSSKPLGFSEMLEILEVSSSFLTYHLESLGELILKTEDGKYRLSTFGEAAVATMTKVEDIPATKPMQFKSPFRYVRRSVVIALGLACLILVASLGATLAFYNSTLTNRDKTIETQSNQIKALNTQLTDQNNTISSLYSQISQLNYNVTNLSNRVTFDNTTISTLSQNITNLQEELQGILNATASAQNQILSNITEWVNKTVTLEGDFEGPFLNFGSLLLPYNSQLTIGNQTIPTYLNDTLFSEIGQFLWYNSSTQASLPVLAYGVVKQGIAFEAFQNSTSWTVYYIEAQAIIKIGDPYPFSGLWTIFVPFGS